MGNYYSLKGKHENAVTYFQRAIKLNSKYDYIVSVVLHQLLIFSFIYSYFFILICWISSFLLAVHII